MFIKQIIKINEYDINTYHWGEKNKSTIILLHGLGSTGLSFNKLADLLNDRVKLIAIDLPGHGESTINSSFSINDIASTIKEVIKHYNLSDFHLLGHSIGGTIALKVSTIVKSKSVILLDGGYLRSIDFPDYSLEDEIEGVKSHYKNNKFKSWKEFEEKLIIEGLSKELIELSKEQMVEIDGNIELKLKENCSINYIKETYDKPSNDLLKSLETKILLLRSTLPIELNNFRNEAVKRFLSIEGFKVIDINNSTHDIYWDQPNTVCKYVNEWIEEINNL